MTIDWWTLGLEAVNVAVLIWLLGRFFWRPVAAIIGKRQAAAAAILSEAEAQRSELEEAKRQIARTRAGFASERDDILAAAHDDGEKERAAIIRNARREAAEIEASARAAAETARKAEEKSWAERSNRLSVEIAARLAARLSGPAVLSAFLDWLMKSIEELPPIARETVSGGGSMKVVTAHELTPEEQRTVTNTLAKGFGAAPLLTFEADPQIIAGIELHGPHFTLSNSWRADLERIRKGLDDGA